MQTFVWYSYGITNGSRNRGTMEWGNVSPSRVTNLNLQWYIGTILHAFADNIYIYIYITFMYNIYLFINITSKCMQYV